MKIGTIIRKLREKHRLSQQEVAEQVGVCQSAYCAWESDRSTPKAKHYLILARVLNVDPKELMVPEFSPVPTLNHSNTQIMTPQIYALRVDLIDSLKETVLLQRQIINSLEKENRELQSRLLSRGIV